MRRLLILSLILILYGSLCPYNFQSIPTSHGHLWDLLHNIPTRFGRDEFADAITNVVLYVPIGFFGLLALAPALGNARGIAAAIAIGFAASFTAECSQLYLITRDPTVIDLVLNVAGTGVGVIAAWFVSHHRAPRWFTEVRPAVDAVLLLVIWAGWQLFPFTPRLFVRPVDHLSTEPWHFGLLYFAGTLAAARLFMRITGRLGWRFVLLQLLILARFGLIARTVSLTELAASAAGTVVALLVPNLPGVPTLFIAAIVLQGVYPFHSGPRQPFSWMPFESLIFRDWLAAFPVFLGKVFRYGTAIWLLNDAGWRWRWAAVAVTLPLALVEILQRQIPGRTPEITDPLLALIMAFTLWSVREAARPSA